MTDVKNIMEIIVEDYIKSVLEEYPDQCQCSICMADIKALTLNQLPPKYIRSAKGGVIVRANETNPSEKVRILQAVAKSVEVVGRDPRH